jgi:(p)ppGpp synthetase, RelA/SpoT family
MVYVESTVHDAALQEAAGRNAWLNSLAEGRAPDEVALIRRAVELAERAHREQTRASGEPYLAHAIAVADILAGLRMDHETLAAAILHDVVEDTTITLEDIEQACSPAVAHLVDGLTKMKVIGEYQATEQGNKKEQVKAESLRKLLLAMAEDVRVVLIKLADRLHNMRTLQHLPDYKQQRIARETLDIYAPLANRLGIWHVKWELEDLAFRYLEPQAYKEIAKSLDERRVDRQRYIDKVLATLREELERSGIKADVKGRPKHIYSIWKKMQRKGLSFHELYDVRALRILVDTIPDCYHALGVVHTLWPHIAKEFDDYIATPKENRYRSIHTAVMGPEGKTIEVQIRTFEMDKESELGVAAHWRYKEGGKSNRDFEQKVAWLRQLLEWKDEENSAGDFIDRFKSEVFQDRVYVLTPQGEVVDMPQGATPLDFAYYIHTEVGNRARGARVDGRMVPITYELKSGEQVEILTARQGEPSRDWLNPHLGYLKTSRARAKVRHWFTQQALERNLAEGRAVLEKELRRFSVSDLPLEQLAAQFGFDQLDPFLLAIGRGDINTTQIVRALQKQVVPPPESGEEDVLPISAPSTAGKSGGAGGVHILGVGNLLTTMARCCKPAPGDAVVGYITQGRGVTIHRRDCRNILNMAPDKRVRLIEVEWSSKQRQTYPVDIEILAFDRQGLLRDITSILSNDKINVLSVNTQTNKQDYSVRMQLTLEIANIDELSRVLGRIGQLPNVTEARRRIH